MDGKRQLRGRSPKALRALIPDVERRHVHIPRSRVVQRYSRRLQIPVRRDVHRAYGRVIILEEK